MKWVALAIAGFIGIYTAVMIGYRKEETPHEPYDQARYRSGEDLREAGWIPFPNAYALAADSAEVRRAPFALTPVSIDRIAPDEPQARKWSHLIPKVQQGEEVRGIEAPLNVTSGDPYIARIHWSAPPEFQGPQLVFFRRDNEILVFSRVPPRQADGSEQSAFLIPPEFLSPGEYRIWLAATDELSLWTFAVK